MIHFSLTRYQNLILKHRPTLLYQFRQGCTISGSSMPLSSTYQMLKLKLGPQDKSGTLRRKSKKREKINIFQISFSKVKLLMFKSIWIYSSNFCTHATHLHFQSPGGYGRRNKSSNIVKLCPKTATTKSMHHRNKWVFNF